MKARNKMEKNRVRNIDTYENGTVLFNACIWSDEQGYTKNLNEIENYGFIEIDGCRYSFHDEEDYPDC